MSSNKSLYGIVAVVVLAVVLSALGLVVFWPADESGNASKPIGQNASDRLTSLDGYTATVETTSTFGNNSTRIVQRVWARPGTGERRTETLEGPGPTLTVSNGSVRWHYNRTTNNVTRYDISGSGQQANQQGEFIERIFTRLNVTSSALEESKTASVTPGSAPLPAVPSSRSSGPDPSESVTAADEFGVSYNGTDTVAGREVYVISIQPDTADNASLYDEYRQTMYVDSEYFLPLKQEIVAEFDGQRFESTTVYRNVTFEPGLDDDRFTFDPPENATVKLTNLGNVQTYDSRSELQTSVDLPVPDPDVPASFELDSVRSFDGQIRFATLQYANETSTLSVGVSNRTDLNATDYEELTVDGRTVRYQQFGTSKSVAWNCGGYRYSVSGSAVSQGLLLEIAGSIECR